MLTRITKKQILLKTINHCPALFKKVVPQMPFGQKKVASQSNVIRPTTNKL